jgi:transposase
VGQTGGWQASDKTVHNTVLSNLATFLATHGVAPGAYIYVADAALVTEDHLAALGDPLFITRLPATYNECGWLIAEAVAHHPWEAVGVLAHTKPTKHRAGTAYKVSEGEVTLYGTAYRAVVVHSSAQDKRRQQRLERDIQASQSTMQATVRTAEQQEDCCRADAAAAAAPRRGVHTPYHLVDVTVEERPVYGRGRPSVHQPRPIKATRYRLKITLRPATESIRRREEEAGCFVLLTNVPTAGDLAHRAREILTVYKEQHGTEQNYGFLKAPVIVHSLFLKKPERMEALGVVWLLSLLLWRLMERAMRRHVDTTSPSLPGWDKKVTERPTAFMMVTKCAGVIVLQWGHDRQLARPLSAAQHHYLAALEVPATCFTRPAG